MDHATKKVKLRPVLDATQIEDIIGKYKAEQPQTDIGFSILAYLIPFLDNARAGKIKPAYVTKSRVEVSLEALGYPQTDIIGEEIGENQKSKEEYWKHCHTLFTANPSDCTPKQVASAKEHMYLNNLLSASEIIEFEKGEGEDYV